MYSTRTHRGLSFSFVLLIALSASRSEAMGDPWPLVNAAERAVWGTLIHTSEGPGGRLLVVAPALTPPAAPVAPVRLLDTVVGLPEGTEVMRGQRGLFLFTEGVPEASGIPSLDGTVLVGGYFTGLPPEPVRDAVTRAVLGDAADPPFSESDAIALLASDWEPARAIALGWLRDQPTLGTDAKAALDASLATDDETWLRSALESYLLRGWEMPTQGLAPLVSGGEDPVLVDLAIHAIEAHGDIGTRADLLVEWSGATIEGRMKLLGAYATLGLTESVPWWQEALASDDPRLWSTALREMGRARLPGVVNAYRAALRSPDEEVLRSALDGVARMRTPEAAALLREFRDAHGEDDPLVRHAIRLLREPARHREPARSKTPHRGDGR